MKLEELLKLLPKNNWVTTLYQIDHLKCNLKITDSELKGLIKEVKVNIDKNRIGRGIDYLALCLWINKDFSLDKFKRVGLFRIFNYLHCRNVPGNLVTFLISNSTLFNFIDSDLKYLDSVGKICVLHEELQQKRKRIISELSKHKVVIVKTLYSYVDSIFQLPDERFEEASVLDDFTNEEIAEGAAYIISLYTDLYILSDDNIVRSDAQYILNKSIENILLDACQIKLIQEQEIWIECAGFICEQDGDGLYIKPPSPEFGKAYRLGNILLDLNRSGQQLLPRTGASIYEFSKLFNERTDNAILHWDLESQRYMLAVPLGVIEEVYNEKYLLNKGIFHEEKQYLFEMEDMLFLDGERFEKHEIIKGFTFQDLLMIRRIWSFFSLAYFDLLEKKNLRHYYTSNIPFLHSNTIKAMLAPAIGEEKVNIFLDTFSFSNESEMVFDMQYSPLLKGNEHYIIPYNVFINSNLFRNILFSLNNRIFNSDIDPISDKLEAILTKRGFFVKKGLKYKYQKQNSDIDIIAIMHNHIFIFECKNSVLPVNAFEFRSVFEQLQKAANKQLPLAVSACKDLSFLRTYNLEIEDPNEPLVIHPCIVTTNRLLSGYEMNGYPVRNIKHLNGFIKKGEFAYTDNANNGSHVYSMWKDDEFCLDDLIEYLMPDTKQYAFMFDSMFEFKHRHKLGKFNVFLSYYPHDDEKLSENFHKLNLKKKRQYTKPNNE